MTHDRHGRIARVWSNQILRDIAPLFSGDVINVSGWKDEDKEGRTYRDYFSSLSAYYISNHEGARGFSDNPATDFFIDLTVSTIPNELRERFDVVFNHTTLEHIFDARTAFRNLCCMSKDVVIIVVPFAQRLHHENTYGDYWRFTPMSLRKLFSENGFEIIFEAASPHANAALYLLFIGSCQPERWRGRMPHWSPLEKVGEWIGFVESTSVTMMWNRIKKKIRGAITGWSAHD